MLQTYTSVLARRIVIEGDYSTPPYEAGWASEAVLFVQTEGEHPDLKLSAEISPDGIHWIQRGAPTVLTAQDALAELTLTTFGNWLRLTITGASPTRTARILVHVNAKG